MSEDRLGFLGMAVAWPGGESESYHSDNPLRPRRHDRDRKQQLNIRPPTPNKLVVVLVWLVGRLTKPTQRPYWLLCVYLTGLVCQGL